MAASFPQHKPELLLLNHKSGHDFPHAGRKGAQNAEGISVKGGKQVLTLPGRKVVAAGSPLIHSSAGSIPEFKHSTPDRNWHVQGQRASNPSLSDPFLTFPTKTQETHLDGCILPVQEPCPAADNFKSLQTRMRHFLRKML